MARDWFFLFASPLLFYRERSFLKHFVGGQCTQTYFSSQPGFRLLVYGQQSRDSQSKWSKVTWQVLSRASHVGMPFPWWAKTHFSDRPLSTIFPPGFWAFRAIFQACLAASVVVVISLFQNCCSCCSCCWPGFLIFFFSFSQPRFLVGSWVSTEKSSCWRKCVCDYLVMASNWVLCLFAWRGSVESAYTIANWVDCFNISHFSASMNGELSRVPRESYKRTCKLK